ncbi:hypothetical protein [Streptomyces canus]|nr:hypothetical protein [Streptomyces canus]
MSAAGLLDIIGRPLRVLIAVGFVALMVAVARPLPRRLLPG